MRRIRVKRINSPQRRSGRRASRYGHGFTLIEMVLVIILVGIIFSMGGVMLGKVFSSYSAKQEIAEADWQAKVALERAARELRAVRTATAADLDVASTAQVRFIDTDGNGTISKTEAQVNAGLAQVFDQADTNKDGELSADEYKAYVAAQQAGAGAGAAQGR